MKPVRRVVTGHDEGGRAIVVSDGAPPRRFDNLGQPGLVLTEVWATSSCPALIANDPDPTSRPLSLAPDPLGSVIRVVDIPPDRGADAALTHEMADEVFHAIGAGGARAADPAAHPGMHRTETIDYGLVLEGEIYLLLEGSEVKLQAGDIVVQRGTIHAWSNRSERPCRIAFVLLDGKYSPEIRPAAAH